MIPPLTVRSRNHFTTWRTTKCMVQTVQVELLKDDPERAAQHLRPVLQQVRKSPWIGKAHILEEQLTPIIDVHHREEQAGHVWKTLTAPRAGAVRFVWIVIRSFGNKSFNSSKNSCLLNYILTQRTQSTTAMGMIKNPNHSHLWLPSHLWHLWPF